MKLDKEFLEKAKRNLEKQQLELLYERNYIAEEILQVKGALSWITQTLELIKTELPS